MSLIVEDGSGVENANSYVTVAFVDEYVELFRSTELEAWDELDVEEKEGAIRRGVLYIENRYRENWRGLRAHRTQGLAWPRAGVDDRDGFSVPANEIPLVLKRASAEAALRASVGDIEPDASAERNISSESKRLGPMSKSVTYVGSKPDRPRFTVIDDFLRGLLRSGPGQILVERG